MSIPKIIVILGPTASGKSELAVKIAKKFNGEIISADSRQVYRGLDIGSGKVPLISCASHICKICKYDNCDTFCDRRKCHNIYEQHEQNVVQGKVLYYKDIPHHLLNVASPKTIFTAARYQKLAKRALKDIIKRGKIPIICGGTGFYIDALIYDYQLPKVPPQPKLRKELEKKSTEELFQQLKKLDPRRAADIDKNNRRRLIRALEICISTGKPIPLNISVNQRTHQRKSATSLSGALKIGIKLPPEELKKRIKKRIKKMVKNGLVQETEKLRKSGLSWQKIYELGFEYKFPALFLQNKIGKKEMLDKMIAENVKYAKRQMTWFKREPKGSASWRTNGAGKNIHWLTKSASAIPLVKEFLKHRD